MRAGTEKAAAEVAVWGLILINAVFAVKYLLRLTDWAVPLTLGYSAAVYAGWRLLWRLPEARLALVKMWTRVAVGLYALMVVVILARTDPFRLGVDRWSVIASFWEAAFQGVYPYLAKSHLGWPPGPFPFYFVLTLPFYLLGEIGYAALAGLFVMLGCLILAYGGDLRPRLAATFLLLSSTAIGWEMAVRSTLLLNAALILLYLFALGAHRQASLPRWALLGAVGGLLLSTRGIFVLPVIICVTYLLVQPRQAAALLVFGLTYVLGFLATLLPFMLWDWDLFVRYNPFTLQTDIIGKKVTLLLLGAALVLGLAVKTLRQALYAAGLLLYAAGVIYAGERIFLHGWQSHTWQHIIDISYLIPAVPFLAASLPGADAAAGPAPAGAAEAP